MKKYLTGIMLVAVLMFVLPGSTYAQGLTSNNNDQQIAILMKLLQLLQVQLATLQQQASAPVTVVAYDDITISYGNTLPLAWSGQGFFSGEQLLVVEVDVKNTSRKSQTVASDSFVIKNAQGISFLPIRESSIKNQPRVAAGFGMSDLGTNRAEILDVTLAKREEVKGALVFYVSEKPVGQYTIEYDGIVTNLKKF